MDQRTQRPWRARLGATAAAALLAAGARADEIVLKNGRTVEGIIKSQTPTHIEIELGAGSMRLERARVAEIRRGSAARHEALRAEWSRTYFLHRRHVPEGLEGIADAFRALMDKREAARSADRAVASTDRRLRAALDELAKLRVALAEVSQELQAAVPERDVTAYNALVRRSNAVQAALTVKQGELDAIERERAAGREPISVYLGAFSAFEADFGRQQAGHRRDAADAARDRFFDGINGRLEELRGEFSEAQIPTQTEGGSTLVSALVNGRATGVFIVDTGAATVTITEDLARRLNINVSALPRMPVVMADGSQSVARAVVLTSVRLGDAQVEGVPAVVLPNPTRPGVDGLLGMSFLRNFQMSLDGATGKLHLRRFRAD